MPEACFIESALKLLDEREKNIATVSESTPENKQVLLVSEVPCNNTYHRSHNESTSSIDSHDEIFPFEPGDQDSDLPLQENTSRITHNTVHEIVHDSEKRGISYFYQAEDGQHIYMHNINVRMLLKDYGTLENAPPIIQAKIVEIESVSMTENLRKRLRYLQHLPLTCEFQVVELNFSHFLEKETLLLFESEINKRKHFRNRKARDERRREKFIEIEENKKLGKYPKATYNLKSIDQFPSYQPSDFQPLSPPKSANVTENISGEVSEDLNTNCGVEGTNLNSVNSDYLNSADAVPTTSFAQMLKDGPKTFTQAFKEKKKVTEIHEIKNADSDEDNWIHPPENQSLNDVLAMALDAVTLRESASNGQKSNKKKKGKKQQLLFTTSMCRNK